MPLIWDDERYLMVDEEDEYDKNRFFIARTLFVKPSTSNNEQNNINEFNEKTLNRYFRKYGDVESIEILNPMEHEAEETTESKAYAYVTFQQSLSAFAAVSDNKIKILEKLTCEYSIQPADSWKQPVTITARQQISKVESMILDEDEVYVPPIFKLNDDCFEELFKYLDIKSSMNLLQVCKKMNTLVHEHGFKHIKSFEYRLSRSISKNSLAQLRRTLKCIGKYINKLTFSSLAVENSNSQRFFEILGEHVGKNIRHFAVVDLKECNIAAIKPILENLTSLDIGSESSELDFELDVGLFRTLCPNLSKLKLNHYSSFVELVDYNKPWPKLQYSILIIWR